MKVMKVTNKKRHLCVICAIVICVLLMVVINEVTKEKNYSELLNADVMNVYNSDGSLLTTYKEPRNILDTYNGIVGVGVIDVSTLGLKKTDFIEMYRLEFKKDGKEISSIRMLTPRKDAEFDEQKVAEYFREFNGKYVVMNEGRHFFIFGEKFYENLIELIVT